MRWGWLVVTLQLAGCGRLGFDALFGGDDVAMPDGPLDGPTGTVTVTQPADGSPVGSSAHVTGTCTDGIAVDFTGAGLAAAQMVSCATGKFAADLVFTSGLGDKLIAVDQGGAAVALTLQRVAAPIAFHAARSNQTQSAGPATDCDLVIAAPEMAEHDLLIGIVYTDNGAGGVDTPADFTRLALDNAHGVAFTHFVADVAAEPASYTFHVTAGTAMSDTCASGGAFVTFANVDPTSHIVAQNAQTGTSANLTAPSVNATAGSLLVGLFGSNGPGSGIPAPNVMTTNNNAMPDGAFAISIDMFANARVAWQTINNNTNTGERAAAITSVAEWAASQVDLRPR